MEGALCWVVSFCGLLLIFQGRKKYPGQICFLSNTETFQDHSKPLYSLENKATVKNLNVKTWHPKRFPFVMHANNNLQDFEQFLVRH